MSRTEIVNEMKDNGVVAVLDSDTAKKSVDAGEQYVLNPISKGGII